jgi:Glycosyl transferase family 2
MVLRRMLFASVFRFVSASLVLSTIFFIYHVSLMFSDSPNQLIKRIPNNAQAFKSDFPPKPVQSPETLELLKRMNLTNPGNLGEPVILPDNLDADIIEMFNKSEDIYKFSEFVASLIPLDRQLADVRSDACKKLNYSTNLPAASVIMVLYNEPTSVVLRTIYSVLNASPAHLIKEITVVDDCSTHGECLLYSSYHQCSHSFNGTI